MTIAAPIAAITKRATYFSGIPPPIVDPGPGGVVDEERAEPGGLDEDEPGDGGHDQESLEDRPDGAVLRPGKELVSAGEEVGPDGQK